MGIPTLFREGATPETQIRQSLEEQGPVVRGPAWLGLALVVLAILGLLAWALSTQVEKAVTASGAMMYAPVPLSLQAPATGTVIEAPPPVGTAVRAGEVLARIAAAGHGAVSVIAPSTGVVLEHQTVVGSVAQSGQTLAQIVPEGAALRAYLYVRLGDGENLRPGQEVLVTPDGPQQQQERLIEGHVVSVDDIPATPARLDQVLGPTLGPRAASGSPVVEVIAALSPASSSHDVLPLRLQTPLSARIILSKSSLFGLSL
jgi:multidrug resistance efflux pump